MPQVTLYFGRNGDILDPAKSPKTVAAIKARLPKKMPVNEHVTVDLDKKVK
jgi:hypothetical protein